MIVTAIYKYCTSGVELYSRLGRLYICIFRPSAQTGSLPFTCMFSSLVSCLVRLYGHSEYQPMRASFSSRCDEYYNLKMLLIGE